MAAFGAVDLQRALYERIQKRINDDPQVKSRWVGVMADVIAAERNQAKLERAMREVFGQHSADAMLLLRREAEVVVDGRANQSALIPNRDANRIQGHEIESRRAG